jgi:MFS family permease
LSIFSTIFLVLTIIFAGWLSDRIGRKPVVTIGLILGAGLILPAFWLMQKIELHAPIAGIEILSISSIMFGLSFILGLLGGPQTAMLAELFPAKSRNSAATFPHNLAAGWIGGTLPFIVTWLSYFFNNQLTGLWWPTAFLLGAGLIAIFYLPETYQTGLLE